MYPILIFINEEAKTTSSLLLNRDWSLRKIYDRVQYIEIDKTPIDWLVKTYPKIKHARTEQKNLTILSGISGIPKLLTTTTSAHFNYNIISYIPGYDLHTYIHLNGICTENTAKPIVRELLAILKEIHKRHVIHKDIKPENIIVGEKIHIIDFEGKETVEYRSPEQWGKNPWVSSKSDIWGVGTTLYYMLTKKSDVETMNGYVEEEYWSSELKDFMGKILDNNYSTRLNATEALYHPWLE